jgi:hypothetical protein
MRLFLVVLIVIASITEVNARKLPTPQGNSGVSENNSDQYLKANCPPSNARLFMEFNDVRALIEVGGSLWQNRQTGAASYEVPIGGSNHVIYSGSIWMAGLDVNGQLKLAAIIFRTGNDFWAGPLSQTVGSGSYDPMQPVGFNATRDFGAATIDPDVCSEYDEFFTITKAEVITYTLQYECNLDPDCDDDFVVSNDALNRINNWPAHGDVSRGQDFYLAPFYDNPGQNTAGDGIYDPSQGDTPWFDDILGRDDVECGTDRRVTLFGDRTNWWVFNDKGNIHTETGADPIGMEIRAQAFSFATNDEVNRMTFYNYEMINRSTQTLFETYFTQYVDADVGFSDDDFVGCDVSRGLGYAYNGTNNDPGGNGAPGYGDNPPAVGVDYFEGPYQDADNLDNVGPRLEEQPDGSFELVVPSVSQALSGKGIVYDGIGIGYSDGIIDNERFGMRRFNYFNRPDIGAPATHDPSSPTDYYNYMTGFWRDNSPIYYGGNGYTGSVGITAVEAAYTYPGDTDPLHFGTEGQDMGWNWTEQNTDGSGNSNDNGDRRFLQSAGPFTLTPGSINNLTVGVVYGRAFEGNSFASVEALRQNDTKAQALFDNCFEILDPPNAPVLEIVELENELVLLLDNPIGNNVDESYAEEDNINIVEPLDGSVIDKVYDFEGYQIYQMSDQEAGVGDIGDIDKARLIAQCDIENDVSRIINFEFDEGLGFAVPVEKVDGSNRGIRHSFQISEDAFATGTPGLVNHKTYYYIAIAYAHNEYKPYDPSDGGLLDGQKIPYISSRLATDGTAIKAVPAIPHSPVPRFDGTVAGLPYGSSPEITELDGTGNGGRSVDLTQGSEDIIVANGSIATPTYSEGAAPIDVKVIDPLNLVDGYFTLQFEDYADIDTASWVLNRYASKGGSLIESVSSDRTIEADNEQIIPEWGISVNIAQNIYPCRTGDDNCPDFQRLAEPLESTIEFADSSKRWLIGLPDNDGFTPQNWISSGEYNPAAAECIPDNGLNDPCCYKDLINQDPDGLFDNILDGTVTTGQFARSNGCGYNPLTFPGSPSYTAGNYNSLITTDLYSTKQPSVDIVFTDDKSKWTRCPVIELNNDDNLSVNNGKPGLLRQSASIDKEGRQAGDAGYVASEADPNGTTPLGMGWFPGYAVDVETGRRLNMAYGENSFLAGQNGADMIWNPTSNFYNSIGSPLFGGQHTVYVFGRIDTDLPNYDQGAYLYEKLETENLNDVADFYRNLSWVMQPMLSNGSELLATDVRIRLRLNQEYSELNLTGVNGGRPMYEWSIDTQGTIKNNDEALAEALEMINVVPNPYYAYSSYERSKLDTRVKITNLPERCKVRIYDVSGKLIRAYDKDSPITSIDWDLKNGDNIPVSGGVYLIHVDVPEIGERVVKFFGGLRQPDLENL